MNDTSESGRAASADDPVRLLVLGLLERIEHFAATVITDRDRRAGGAGTDLGPAVRATIETVIGEVGELATTLIGAIIAVLEAISAALEEAIAARGRRPDRSPAGPTSRFQPIAVEIETGEPHL